MPGFGIIAEAKKVLNELRPPTVPPDQIQHVATHLRDRTPRATEPSPDAITRSRASSHRFLWKCDSWNTCTDWLFSVPIRWSSCIVSCITIAASLGILTFLSQHCELRLLFITGGLLVVIVRVLLKFPGPSGYRHIASYVSHSVCQIFACIKVSMIGRDLLVSGLIGFSFVTNRNFPERFNTFTRKLTTPREGALLVSIANFLGFNEKFWQLSIPRFSSRIPSSLSFR